MAFNLASVSSETRLRAPRIVLLGVEKIGKALDVNTLIPMPTGYSRMGDLQVGDIVFDKDGWQTRVTNATPIMLGRPCNRVRFGDGSCIVADDEHQWLVCRIRDNEAVVKTTAEIRNSLARKRRSAYPYAVPVAQAVNTTTIALPIDPYTLGAWLGDGNGSDGRVTIAYRDSDIGAKLPFGPVATAKRGCTTRTILGLKKSLRAMGLLNNKHIPVRYLRAGYEDRLALLRGIMDTDGYCAGDTKGTCEFTSTCWTLAFDVRKLLATLGIKSSVCEGVATLNGKTIGPKYRVFFWPCVNVFCTRCKANRLALRTSERKVDKNAIVAVEPIDSVSVRCIEVDSPSHTYLAGDTCIVTHNSTFAAGAGTPAFIPIRGEEGIDEIEAMKYPTCNTLDDVMACMYSLFSEQHDSSTAVIDSASTLEPLIWADVCQRHGNVDSIEKVGGGYGKGYTESLTVWRKITEALDSLRNERNMASILVGHVKIKRFDDPCGDSYDTYQFDINDRAANLLYRWADVILFANTKVVVKREDVGFSKEKHRGIDITDGARFLYTQKRPAHPGGGRGSFGRLPYELPLNFGSFMDAVAAARQAK